MLPAGTFQGVFTGVVEQLLGASEVDILPGVWDHALLAARDQGQGHVAPGGDPVRASLRGAHRMRPEGTPAQWRVELTRFMPPPITSFFLPRLFSASACTPPRRGERLS